MSYKSFVRALKRGELRRRDVLLGLAAVGIVPAVFKRPALAADALTVFGWAGYEDPMFHGSYVKKHGASPQFSFYGELEEGLQKLRGGFTADVVHPCSSSVERWNDAGVLRPLDVDRIEHWEDIFPSFRSVPGVKIGDDYFNMPWDWGNESILYRTDLVTLKEPSIALLMDERYQGKMAMFDSAESMGAVAGVLSGAANPFSLTDAELPQATEVMKKINANMRFYWTDATQITQALAAGELVAAWGWNAAVTELKKQGLPIEYMQPNEGIFTWVCGLSLCQNAPASEQLAYDYLNAMLDPESGKALIVDYGYGHSNQKSFDLVDAARLEELGIADPTAMLQNTHVYEPTPAATKEKLIAIFDQVKSGL
jgi:spermidine/putrescine transport system substrate-binding protein